MSWRDLPVPPADDWYEMEKPSVRESRGSDLSDSPVVSEIKLTFTDDLSRQWYAEWLRSKRGWQEFNAWADERR